MSSSESPGEPETSDQADSVDLAEKKRYEANQRN